MKTISIIREFRKDEKRTPLIPDHIKKLKIQYPNIEFIVQPSDIRCFSNKDYQDNGAIINENISGSDLLLGVKEVEPNLMIPSKTYLFFSHTSKIQSDNSAAEQGTPGMDKKELINTMLKKKITVIDYENIRDNSSRRYLGFGRFAGIVGCYNSLNLYLKINNKKMMPKAYEINSYEKLKGHINQHNFENLKIIVTGDGRVAKGTLEFLEYANIDQININDFNDYEGSKSVYCNLTTSDYVKHKQGKKFELQDFINSPNMYISTLEKFLPYSSMLISSHYWDPKSPKLFNRDNIKKFNNLKVIGDITCDVNGSIPTTTRSTTIEDPYYYINKETFKETGRTDKTLAIMAVDNLPSELSKDSSKEFGDGIVSEVLPYIINSDDGRISKATITANGNFTNSYKYLNDYLNK